jgi:hypothetical protein
MCPNRFILSDLLANMRLSPVHSSDGVKELLFGTDPLSRTAQSGKLLPLLRDPLGIRVAGAGGGRTGFGIENKE